MFYKMQFLLDFGATIICFCLLFLLIAFDAKFQVFIFHNLSFD